MHSILRLCVQHKKFPKFRPEGVWRGRVELEGVR